MLQLNKIFYNYTFQKSNFYKAFFKTYDWIQVIFQLYINWSIIIKNNPLRNFVTKPFIIHPLSYNCHSSRMKPTSNIYFSLVPYIGQMFTDKKKRFLHIHFKKNSKILLKFAIYRIFAFKNIYFLHPRFVKSIMG